MEKERARANEQGYESPIQADRNATNTDYNKSLEYCIDNVESISFCNASHNIESNQLFAQWMEEKKIPFNSCQCRDSTLRLSQYQ